MTAKLYTVTLHRVNEGEHQPSQESFEASRVEVREDGSLSFETPQGGRVYGATSWGRFDFVRVPGR